MKSNRCFFFFFFFTPLLDLDAPARGLGLLRHAQAEHAVGERGRDRRRVGVGRQLHGPALEAPRALHARHLMAGCCGCSSGPASPSRGSSARPSPGGGGFPSSRSNRTFFSAAWLTLSLRTPSWPTSS